MTFTKRLGLSALLCAALAHAAFGAGLRTPKVWSHAIMTALPKTQEHFMTPAGRGFLEALEAIKDDPARLERVLTPLALELRKNRKGPKAIQKNPEALAGVVDRFAASFNDRAAAIIDEAGPLGVLIGTLMDPIVVKDAREAETLLMDAFPYLTPENRKGLGAIYDQLRSRAGDIENSVTLQRAHNLAQELGANADDIIQETLGFPPVHAALQAARLPEAYAVRNIAEEAAGLADSEGASKDAKSPYNLLAEIARIRKRLSEFPTYGMYAPEATEEEVLALAGEARTLLYRLQDLLPLDFSLKEDTRAERLAKVEELLKRLYKKSNAPS